MCTLEKGRLPLRAFAAVVAAMAMLAGGAVARADQAAPRDDTSKISFDSGWQFALVAQDSFTQATADPTGLYYNPSAGTGAPFLSLLDVVSGLGLDSDDSPARLEYCSAADQCHRS